MDNSVKILITYVLNLGKAVDNSFHANFNENFNENFKKISKKENKYKKSIIDFDKDLLNEYKTKHLMSELIISIYENKFVKKQIKEINPYNVSYNQSCVMFISSFEIFLQEIFIYLVDLDKKLQEQIFQSELKININF